jgi:hypothetical protein
MLGHSAPAETSAMQMRVATIKYPIPLSLRIRTFCVQRGWTLSRFFQTAAEAYLERAGTTG